MDSQPMTSNIPAHSNSLRRERPVWWRCYPLYWQSFAQGSRDLLRLPAQSLPFVLSLALMLALFLTIASLSRSLLVQPIPGIDKIGQIQLLEAKVDIGPAVMNIMSKEMLPGIQQALAGPGEFSFLGFGTGKLKLAQQHDVITIEANAGAVANLGVPLILGQPPIEANNRHEVWLSEALWQQLFAGDPNIIGQTLQLDEETLTIRGVLAHFVGHRQAKNNQPLQLWRFYQLKDLGPLKMKLTSSSNNLLLYRHPDARPLDTAAVGEWLTNSKDTTAFKAMFSGMNMTPAISQQPYLTWIQGESATLALVLLAVAIVLLVITVLNLTNLCAGRFTSRQRDMALQLVAGCTIGRLRGLLYLEILAWTLPALCLSVLLALWLQRLLPALTGNLFPIVHHLQVSGVDLIVLVVVVGILTSALSWPLVPKSLQHQLQPVLAGSGKGMQQHKGLSKTVLFSQLGLSAVLVLTAASLTLSGYQSIYTKLGYRLSNAEYFNLEQSLDLDDVVAASKAAELNPKKAAAEEKMRHQAWLELQQRLQKKLPQHQVLLSTGLPIHSRFFAENLVIPPQNNERMVLTSASEPSFHQAFGMTLLHGRWLTPADAEAANNLQPILINEQLAKQIAGDDLAAAIGQSLTKEDVSFQIVGVLQDVKQYSNTANMYKVLRSAEAFGDIGIAIVSAADLSVDRAVVEQTIQELPNFGAISWFNLKEEWAGYTKQSRLNFYLISLLTATSLLLAILGIAGIGRLHSHQRRFELAVRLATGARLKQLYWLVLAPLLPLLAAAVLLSVWASNQVLLRLSVWWPQLETLPLSWQAGLVVSLWTIAALACWWPVRQALRADPLQSLRSL
ncbi:ABC transporter permease [Rheinheimera riviphila]|uniref:ABC transporter permease n=1 Tax=Rheinheimera riviphila TaxID=1834037 RepID=A0A437QLP9_9GAMM|nr:ABC transporter permease [Rheinheimera riviphila]RVU35443.1 ABC transporter permease [Rheinheimera riviphila]